MTTKISKLNCAHLRSREHVQLIRQILAGPAPNNPGELNISTETATTWQPASELKSYAIY
ncbi:MAG: hypothetical protein LBV26_08645 [Bacteroidales bacterium]|nr:hypothetical protein [Bacteroidales bacterium]